MEPNDDPRFVALFRQTWGPAHDLATRLVGAEHAEHVTVDVFARLLERWHRLGRRSDIAGRALARTAEACVAHARREGTSVARRAADAPQPWAVPGTTTRSEVTVDPALRAGVTAMPRKVAVAFVLRDLTGRNDDAVATATGTSRRTAAARADRGLAILRREAGPGGHGLLDG